MEQTINRIRYDTGKATEVASDRYWDGHNWERNGRNRALYLTPKGNYFIHNTTLWMGEHDCIIPLSKEDATHAWDCLPEHLVTYEEAYGIVPEEA